MKNNSKIKLSRFFSLILPPVLFFLLALFLARGVLFEPGTLFSRDFVYPAYFSELPVLSWNEQDSAPNLEINKIPLNLFLNFISSITQVETGSLLLLITFFLVPTIFYYVARSVFRSNLGLPIAVSTISAALGALFYLLNPWVMDRISNHINMVLSVSLMPLIVSLYLSLIASKLIDIKKTLSKAFILASIVTLYTTLSSHNIFYIFPIIIFIAILFIFLNRAAKAKNVLLAVALTIFFYVLLNLYWILPTIAKITLFEIIKPAYSFSLDNIASISARNSVLNIFQLNGGGAWDAIVQFPQNILLFFIESLVSIILISIVIAAFTFCKKNLYIKLAAVFSLLLIAFGAGLHSPIHIYEFLFNTPLKGLVWLYRDPSRLIQYLVFIYAAVFSYGIIAIYTRLKIRTWFLVAGALFILVLITPWSLTLANKGGGYIVSSDLPQSLVELNNNLAKEEGDFKIMWWPMFDYFFYGWSNVPSVTGDILGVVSPKSTYAKTSSAGLKLKMLRFIYSKLFLTNKTSELGSILNLLNIKYIIVHDDLVKSQASVAPKLIAVMSRQEDFSLVAAYGEKYYLFKNNYYSGRDNFIYSLKQGDLYKDTAFMELYAHELNNWSNFSFEYSANSNISTTSPLSFTFDLNNKINNYYIKWKYNIEYLNSYDKLKIFITPNENNTGSEMQIVLNTSAGNFAFNRYALKPGEQNELNFDLETLSQKEKNLRLLGIEMHLFRKVSNKTYYTVGLNSFRLEKIIFEPDEKYGKYEPNNILEMFKSVRNEMLIDNQVIIYKKINNTKYQIKIDAEEPFVLAFAEGYDPSWRLVLQNENCEKNKINSFPLYAVINGFEINCVGTYDAVIEFVPQKWFCLGLIISDTTLLGCLGYLGYDFYRRRRGALDSRLRGNDKKEE